MKNKCTLLVDGNWLLISRLFTVKEKFNINNDEETKKAGQAELADLMARSINIVINQFSDVIDNMIIVADGGSWRKKLEKPACYEEVYKGNREKAPDTDWEYVYGTLDNIRNKANEIGITTSKEFYCEGDDWIAYWSNKLNNDGINTIIWSIDNDLKQLVGVRNNHFTAWYEKRGGLVLPKELDDTNNSDIDNFFMMLDTSNPVLDALRSKADKIEYINPDDIVMEKIICGDAGDNIKSIIRIQKGKQTHKVSEKDWLEVKEQLGIETLQQFFDSSENIIDALLSRKRYNGYPRNNAIDMFAFNIKLVWLNRTVVPDYIYEKMSACEYKNYDMSYIRSNYKMLTEENTEQIENIFGDAIADMPF